MALPSLQNWLFSLKTFAAAMLALSVGLWLDLPRPYWAVATVYIASNPLSGATRSKAIYRITGTLIGAVASVALVPNLVNAPVLLVLAISLWTGACLYVSLLDRSPRSYVFMLAGYTTALIGFPAVDAPGSVFDIALARSEEILLGILCAALVSSLVLPQRVGPVAAQRLRTWLTHADENARDTLTGESGPAREAHRLRLAADTAEIETLAAHLAFDTTHGPRAAAWVRHLQPRMLMLLPVLSSISDRLDALVNLGGPSPTAARLTAEVRAWIVPARPREVADTDAAHRLLSDITAEIERPDRARDWRSLLEVTLLMRLRDLVEIRHDCLTLSDAIGRELPRLPEALTFPIEERVAPVKHRDHGLATMAGAICFVTVAMCCAFWIAFAWPDGGTAAMMAAVSGCLFAAQDDPVPSLAVFTKWAAGAVVVASVYLFAILPGVHYQETLILALAPAFVTFGLLMSQPPTGLIGLSLAVNSASLIALQETYAVDAASFMNATHALVGGMAMAAVLTALLRPVGAEGSLWRLARANRATLAGVASAATRHHSTEAAGLMLDRLTLLAPRAAAAGHTMPAALQDIRTGFNIVELQRALPALSPYARRRTQVLLRRLESFYVQPAARPDADLLTAIDRALSSVVREPTEAARQAVVGLVGLRRSLFSAAPFEADHLHEAAR